MIYFPDLLKQFAVSGQCPGTINLPIKILLDP